MTAYNTNNDAVSLFIARARDAHFSFYKVYLLSMRLVWLNQVQQMLVTRIAFDLSYKQSQRNRFMIPVYRYSDAWHTFFFSHIIISRRDVSDSQMTLLVNNTIKYYYSSDSTLSRGLWINWINITHTAHYFCRNFLGISA